MRDAHWELTQKVIGQYPELLRQYVLILSGDQYDDYQMPKLQSEAKIYIMRRQVGRSMIQGFKFRGTDGWRDSCIISLWNKVKSEGVAIYTTRTVCRHSLM